MKKFYKKNDVGILIENFIVAEYDENNIKYIIFTDFTISNNELNLYVGEISSDGITFIENDISKNILQKFKKIAF